MVTYGTNPPETTIVGATRAGMHKAAEPNHRQRWLELNRDAIDQYNARIERDGLTLARYRRF
jgi:post-segregation antitoxin (ccd killing protein)